MPLTQDRMIAVIEEAERARDTLHDVRRTVSDIITRAQDARAALSAIRAYMEATSVTSMPSVEREAQHFRTARQRNTKNAERMRRARGER